MKPLEQILYNAATLLYEEELGLSSLECSEVHNCVFGLKFAGHILVFNIQATDMIWGNWNDEYFGISNHKAVDPEDAAETALFYSYTEHPLSEEVTQERRIKVQKKLNSLKDLTGRIARCAENRYEPEEGIQQTPPSEILHALRTGLEEAGTNRWTWFDGKIHITASKKKRVGLCRQDNVFDDSLGEILRTLGFKVKELKLHPKAKDAGHAQRARTSLLLNLRDQLNMELYVTRELELKQKKAEIKKNEDKARELEIKLCEVDIKILNIRGLTQEKINAELALDAKVNGRRRNSKENRFYPYVIVRMMPAVYRKLKFNTEDSHPLLRDECQRYAVIKGLDCCLVFASNRCIYYKADGKNCPSDAIPDGGLQLPMKLTEWIDVVGGR